MHYPVLKKEILTFFDAKKIKTFADLTLGGGSDAKAFLELMDGSEYQGLFFDLDINAINSFSEWLETMGFKTENLKPKNEKIIEFKKGSGKVYLINDNFTKLKEILVLFKIENLDFVLADLGWSSIQLETLSGLSYTRREELLDMRFDQTLSVKASDLLNFLGKDELKKMFFDYSDIRGKFLEELTNKIVETRSKRAIITVDDFIQVAEPVIKKVFKTIHFKDELSRIFQALRIAVNLELVNLRAMMNESFELLSNEGRLIVITFHSGEERVVEEFIKNNNINLLTKRADEMAIRPTIEELKENIRSRSAKLYCVEK